MGGSYSSAEMQSVYSTALANWATRRVRLVLSIVYILGFRDFVMFYDIWLDFNEEFGFF